MGEVGEPVPIALNDDGYVSVRGTVELLAAVARAHRLRGRRGLTRCYRGFMPARSVILALSLLCVAACNEEEPRLDGSASDAAPTDASLDASRVDAGFVPSCGLTNAEFDRLQDVAQTAGFLGYSAPRNTISFAEGGPATIIAVERRNILLRNEAGATLRFRMDSDERAAEVLPFVGAPVVVGVGSWMWFETRRGEGGEYRAYVFAVCCHDMERAGLPENLAPGTDVQVSFSSWCSREVGAGCSFELLHRLRVTDAAGNTVTELEPGETQAVAGLPLSFVGAQTESQCTLAPPLVGGAIIAGVF